jgi:hypothetical protein
LCLIHQDLLLRDLNKRQGMLNRVSVRARVKKTSLSLRREPLPSGGGFFGLSVGKSVSLRARAKN